MAGYYVDFKSIKRTQAEYQKENIDYNRKAMAEEVKRLFPNDKDIDLDNPKYAHILKDLPYAPSIMGGLAKEFGINQGSLSLELWEDLSHGYAPISKIPDGSRLLDCGVDTPRGKMVMCNQTSSSIDEEGKYITSGKANSSLEMVFGMGGNINKVLARMASKDVSVNKKMKRIADRIFRQEIMPMLLEDARIKKGVGGITIERAKELLAVSFFHIENRSVEPFYHFHFDVMNMAMGYDGQLNALDSSIITKNKDAYNAKFQSKMKAALEKEFGFVLNPVYVERDRKNIDLKDEQKNIMSYDLSDEWVPENIREYYSKRSKDMESAKGGKEGFIAQELARLKSRSNKSNLSPSEMFAMWNKEMDEMGWSVEDVQKKQDFNYKRPNRQSLPDEIIIENFERKIHQQWTSKNGPVQCYVEKEVYAELSIQEKIVLASGFSLANEDEMIENFYRKHGEISFTEAQFRSHIVKQLLNDFDEDLAYRHAERMFQEHGVQILDKDKVAYYEDYINGKITDPYELQQKQLRWVKELQFTTKGIIEKEHYISESLMARKSESHMVFDKNEVKRFILKWENNLTIEKQKNSSTPVDPVIMSDEQRQAVTMSLCELGGYINVSGYAGAGKSFALKCIKDFLETKGHKMFGASISSAATDNLAKSCDMKKGEYENISKTLIDLESGKIKWDNKTVLCIDEMGMISLSDCYKVVKYANEAGAKIIGSGDIKQLQSVGVGSVYRILNDQFITARVNKINRQKDDWQKIMVENFACGKSEISIKALYDNGKVFIDKTSDDAVKNLATQFVNDVTDFKSKIILASTNYDVDRLNQATKSLLLEKGLLSSDPKDSVEIKCRDEEVRQFTIGDRIVFTKNFKNSNAQQTVIKNSETGTVTGFRMSKLRKGKVDALIIKTDDGKESFIKYDSSPGIALGYSSTVHRSQGQTKWNAYWFVSDMQNLHSAYVSASRHVNEVKMFLSEELAEKFVDNMEDKEPTAKMIQVATWLASKSGETLSPEILTDFIECRSYLNQCYEKYDDRGIEARHPMDDFISIIESMSKTAYHKSVFDYKIIDGEISGAYQHIKELQTDMRLNPNKYEIEKDIIVYQPKIVPVEEKEITKETKQIIEDIKKDSLSEKIKEFKKKQSALMSL